MMKTNVKQKFDTYPDHVSPHLLRLRELIMTVAEDEAIAGLQESLKWGEPSFQAKGGSTIRYDWKQKNPDQSCLYFICSTRLVETFKEIFGDVFTYDGDRAIVLKIGDEIPLAELRQCISMTLRYHQLKHLPLLGA